MKLLFNISTDSSDLERYQNQEEFLYTLKNFDGVELLYLNEDEKSIIPKDKIFGLHLHYFYTWIDFWNNDTDKMLEEFKTLENAYEYYGGSDRSAIIKKFKDQLEIAEKLGVEYVVYHVSDTKSMPFFTGKHEYTSDEVIDGTIEIINEVFDKPDGKIALLLENLWYPGLTFTNPDETKRLMDGVNYKNKGIMLDTGHLLHTNLNITSQEEGVDYINKMIDKHEHLLDYVRGMHVHQSITSNQMKEFRKNPPELPETYEEISLFMHLNSFKIDRHLPWTCPGVDKIIERVNPEWVNFEFMSRSREEHRSYLDTQLKALGYKK